MKLEWYGFTFRALAPRACLTIRLVGDGLRDAFHGPHLGMGANLYRDANIGVRARLAELAARVRDREKELNETFWASLEPYVRERLDELRSALVRVNADSLDELTRAEGQLSAYADELDHWIARVPALEEEWLERPDVVADPPRVPLQGMGLETIFEGSSFVARFTGIVREMHAQAEIVEDGGSCLARFRHRDAPFSLRASSLATASGQLGEAAMQLVTSVARATPRLLVRHESLFTAVGKALGFKHDVQVGDASFDGLFLIEGAKHDVRRLLPPNVRASLMALARFDVPTLEIDPPGRLASLTWFFEPTVAAIDAAVRTLFLIREAPREISFCR